MSSILESKKIAVIGAGIMGRTLIGGMLDARLIGKSQVCAAVNTRRSREKVATEFGIDVHVTFPSECIGDIDIFLICTKPHGVIPILKTLVSEGTMKPEALVVSIAAGVTLAQMEAVLDTIPAMRAMPNTPCLIGAGATVIARGSHTLDHHLSEAEAIFKSVGTCFRLAEKHLNAVTAVSGSGPAYGFLIMEALADGAVKVGLPRDVAFKLVSQTMLGAALMMQQTGKHPATLKDEVTTPSGCTISALLTMEDGKIRSTLARAVEEATRIASQLG